MEHNQVNLAGLFIKGQGFLGLLEESDVPAPTATMTEHSTISSIGTLNFKTGFELMEARFKWKGMDEKIEAVVNNPYVQVDLQMRYVIEKMAGTGAMRRVPCIVFMKGRFRSGANSNLSPKSTLDSESMFDIDYIRKEIDKVVMYEFDPINFIHKVNGVDMLAEIRTILGVA